MSKDKNMPLPDPTIEQLESELAREKNRRRFTKALRATLIGMLVFAAIVLALSLLFPVLRVQSSAMTPAYNNGDYLVIWQWDSGETGDVIAFKHENKVLIRRVIAGEGDVVNAGPNGEVIVNGVALDGNNALAGDAWTIDLPCTVPVGHVFVLGDNGETAVDSRSAVLGCVKQDQIIGRVMFRIWPIEQVEEIIDKIFGEGRGIG